MLPKGKNTKLEMQHTNIVCKDGVTPHILGVMVTRSIGNIKAKQEGIDSFIGTTHILGVMVTRSTSINACGVWGVKAEV